MSHTCGALINLMRDDRSGLPPTGKTGYFKLFRSPDLNRNLSAVILVLRQNLDGIRILRRWPGRLPAGSTVAYNVRATSGVHMFGRGDLTFSSPVDFYRDGGQHHWGRMAERTIEGSHSDVDTSDH
jgi:hypothetical protein